ncbi:hypothetical protein N0D28_00110 [Deinococcus rubellus]|uniref:Uncharacterized protein n=1 Tax=Deinococcus rubellus TaxID=1889240 RepID=A0ABY5YGS4_9DEIO|nr:hypothetical protein [Deinococcus rubellus]UWX64121.1 hypothetical protein N0D28_00110 [Deinococcus rubellus]
MKHFAPVVDTQGIRRTVHGTVLAAAHPNKATRCFEVAQGDTHQLRDPQAGAEEHHHHCHVTLGLIAAAGRSQKMLGDLAGHGGQPLGGQARQGQPPGRIGAEQLLALARVEHRPQHPHVGHAARPR